MKKIDYIDFLRALAILGVIMVHTNQYGIIKSPAILDKFLNQGARGVQLFYLASAFTLFLSLKNRTTNEKFPIRNFFLRRFFRIAPMYYIGIIYYIWQDGLGARYWLGTEQKITIYNIFANLTFTHGFNPFWITSLVPGGWSIAVEMMFYLIVPFLHKIITNLNVAIKFFLSSIILQLFLFLIFTKFPLISDLRLWDEYLFLYFPSQMPVFALGIILYFVIIENETLKMINSKIILIFCLVYTMHLVLANNLVFNNHVLFSFLFFIFTIAICKTDFKIVTNPILIHIGKISFSLYLIHFAILHWLEHYKILDCFQNGLINYIFKFFTVLLFSIIIGTLSYKYIEQPFIAFGKKLINRFER